MHVSTLFVALSFFIASVLYKIDKNHETLPNPRQAKPKKSENAQSNRKCYYLEKLVTDVSEIDKKIWIISAVLIFFYNGVSPFYSQGVKFFTSKYGLTGAQSGRILSIIDFISACLAPIVGIITDRYKNNVYIAQFGISLCLVANLLLAWTYIDPHIPIFIMGVGFSSLSSSLWPYINIMVPLDKLGSVNGAISSVQSGIFGSVVLISGKVLQTNGYFSLFLLLLFNLYMAFFINTQFIIFNGNGFDHSHMKVLNALESENSEEKKKKLNIDANSAEKNGNPKLADQLLNFADE